MATSLLYILKTARPRQWIKNFTLYAALVFTGFIYTRELWWRDFWIVSASVGAFTFVAISVYFLNDIHDVAADRAHPFKKKRPIASGDLPVPTAWLLMFIFGAIGLLWAFYLSTLFGLVVLGYSVMQVLYSYWLKNIEVVDVFIIAIGFFLRVLAGAIVINGHLSIWFLLCVVCVSLFLAVGKRRGELAILTEQAAAHRKVMSKYTTPVLDAYVAMFATAAFFSWALYSFNFYEQNDSTASAALTLISKTLTINKWLMATIPIVIFGIMRYLYIIYDGARAETPERVIMSDKQLILAVTAWFTIVMLVLYWLPK